MKGKRVLVTGGAGFIGSNMCNKLLEENEVLAIDNFMNVDDRYIKDLLGNENFSFRKADITVDSDMEKLENEGQFDAVIHLAANSDVRGGSVDTHIDLNVNVQGTYNVLEFCRKTDIGEIMFASSSTVTGEAAIIPTPESYGPPAPISTYGASKLAGEGFISAYSHYYGIRGTTFRFANIVGRNSTHGVIFDFLMKLKKDPRRLEILGDGTQRKSYLHVDDCVAGMLHLHKVSSRTDVFNLGNSETTSVMDIARFVVDGLGLPDVKLETTVTEGGRGWRGDVKYAQLSTEKAEKAGWKSTMSSDKSVERAVKEMISQLREQSVI